MKKETQYKWVSAAPIICTIVYFILAYVLDKFTSVNKPYLLCLVIYLFVPLSYYIVGLKKFKLVFPTFIVLLYLISCAFIDGVFGISLWHPLWVILLTIPIYYIFTGKQSISITKDNITKEFKNKVNQNKTDDCDFDADK